MSRVSSMLRGRGVSPPNDFAHRPSPAWLAIALDRIGMRQVYVAAERPAHRDYRLEWRSTLDTARDGHLLRSVLVGSRTALQNERLISPVTSA